MCRSTFAGGPCSLVSITSPSPDILAGESGLEGRAMARCFPTVGRRDESPSPVLACQGERVTHPTVLIVTARAGRVARSGRSRGVMEQGRVARNPMECGQRAGVRGPLPLINRVLKEFGESVSFRDHVCVSDVGNNACVLPMTDDVWPSVCNQPHGNQSKCGADLRNL